MFLNTHYPWVKAGEAQASVHTVTDTSESVVVQWAEDVYVWVVVRMHLQTADLAL